MPRELPPLPDEDEMTKEDVVGYLLRCKAEGRLLGVYQGPESIYSIYIDTPLENRIRLWAAEGTTLVIPPGRTSALDEEATNLREVERLIAIAAAERGEDWPSQVTTGRLSATTPASNVVTISKLVGAGEIQAVFDPYLDNASFATLLDILSFGASLSNDARFLTGQDMTGGAMPRLTKSFLTYWFTERGVTGGQVRLLPAKSEHRRFMLLKDGQSLLVGMSLNSIAKNEAVRLESDKEDRPFFNSTWATAQPF
jgi:hypothetical protein